MCGVRSTNNSWFRLKSHAEGHFGVAICGALIWLRTTTKFFNYLFVWNWQTLIPATDSRIFDGWNVAHCAPQSNRPNYLLFILLICLRTHARINTRPPTFSKLSPAHTSLPLSVLDVSSTTHIKWPAQSKLPVSRPVAKPLANNSPPRLPENPPPRTCLLHRLC